VSAGSAQITGTVSYANAVASFTPSSTLSTNTVYTVTISNVKDIIGNSLVSAYSFTFTTSTINASEFITIGSSANDVSRLQGTPSSIANYTDWYVWQYGALGSFTLSTSTNAVISWNSNNNGLKVLMVPGSQVTNATAITLGTHVDDVIRLQGTPSSITNYTDWYVWQYGALGSFTLSTSTNAVISWNSYNDGLKVLMVPGSHVTNATTITLGTHVDDVIRLQGTPSSIANYTDWYVWQYGALGSFTLSTSTDTVTAWNNNGGLIVSGP
jgi:hypothetical protein